MATERSKLIGGGNRRAGPSRGPGDPGVALLRKPYRKPELSQKIREMLADARAA